MFELRAPSDRSVAWAHWRERVAGESRGVTTEPECGLYKMKRGGRWVGVQIDILSDIDAITGELMSEEEMRAWIDGVEGDALEAWEYCAGQPISAIEFEQLKDRPVVRDLTREVIT